MLDLKIPDPPTSPSLISLNGFRGRKAQCFLSVQGTVRVIESSEFRVVVNISAPDLLAAYKVQAQLLSHNNGLLLQVVIIIIITIMMIIIIVILTFFLRKH